MRTTKVNDESLEVGVFVPYVPTEALISGKSRILDVHEES